MYFLLILSMNASLFLLLVVYMKIITFHLDELVEKLTKIFGIVNLMKLELGFHFQLNIKIDRFAYE